MTMTNQPEMTSRQQTLQQQRAAQAWIAVESVPAKIKADYASLVKGVPAMVQRDGLGATLAFLYAKAAKDPNHERMQVYQHLSQWLMHHMKQPAQTELIEYMQACTSAEYRRIAVEAQAYLVWLKRWAEATTNAAMTNNEAKP